jgi:SSS family solute:Na+ symporter/sodium/pantothenate symporter
VSLGIVSLYLVLLIGVAEVARRARSDLSPRDHFLAGGSLGVFVLFLTLYATAYSGNSLLGYPGEAYEHGFVWIQSTGFMMAIIVGFHILAPKLRVAASRNGFVTPGDWVRHRFGEVGAGRGLRIGVGILMTWALANFLFAQLQAMGELTETITEGRIPHAAGVLGLALMILFYETLGGMRAVAWTDSAQGILMLVGLATLLAWLLGESGGMAELTRSIQAVRPEAVAVPDAQNLARWSSTIVLLGLGSVVYPQAIQRIYAARSGKTLSRSFALMTFMPLTTTFVVMLIGLAAIPRFEGLGVLEKDAVMPLLLGQWAEGGPAAMVGAVIVFVGALAAIMSTADSVLLSLGSVVAVDLFDKSRDDPETTRLGKRIGMVAMAVAIALAWAPQFDLWRLIELKMELLIQCVPAFLLAIHWKRLDAKATLAGLIAGSLLAGGAALMGETRIAGVHVGVIGLGLNLAVLVGVQSFNRSRAIA